MSLTCNSFWRRAALFMWIAAPAASVACALPAWAGKTESPLASTVTELHADAFRHAQLPPSPPLPAKGQRPVLGSGAVHVDKMPFDISRLRPNAFGDWDEPH